MELLLVSVLALLAGLAIGWLLSRSQMGPRLAAMEKERDYAKQESDRLISAVQTEREETEQRARQSLETMKAEFHTLSQQVLDLQTKKLNDVGNEQFSTMMRPLKEHLNTLERAIQDSNEKRAAQRTSFEEAMKHLSEQTVLLSEQTDRLTRALKGDSKAQGDWGEMILESILKNSGLRRDEEYFVQENVKADDEKNLRPDIIVKFPDERSVIIDSKVSLTAYMDYLESSDEAAKSVAAKAHADSVNKHVDELARKKYSDYVKNAGNYVLMFLQSDAAYILAVKIEPKLSEEAFKKRVIVVCPTTLMMTLQIIYNIWQSDRQSRNVENIVQKASALYDKIVGFTESFKGIGKNLSQASAVYQHALGQLSEGKGNLVNRAEELRRMGLTPKKRLPADLLQQAGEDNSDGNDDNEADNNKKQ